MKKALLALVAVPALCSAQYADFQLANTDFEGDWVECIPWTSKDNTMACGTQPQGWKIANVIGMGGLGATQVGAETAGYESEKAVLLTNKANSIMPTQIVPGYFTLGTPWNTSVMGQRNDGGTFGGIDFAGTPDAVTFMYKRAYGVCPDDASEAVQATYNPTEPFNVVAYSWVGSTWQEDVPGNIVAFGNPAKVKMKDRDRNILGIDTYYGGEVTRSNDFLLVCSLNDTVEGAAADWTRLTLPLTYTAKHLTPEKFNIIFSSGNYFENAGLGCENSLALDDVRLLYYSRLSSVTYNGEPLAGFSPDKYVYYVDCADMTDFAFDAEYTTLGYGAAAHMNGTETEMTITVTNPQGVDADGLDKHVYHFYSGQSYQGLLNITMMGEAIAEGQEATVVISPTGEEGLVNFSLPNFAISLDGGAPVTLGDISVDNMEQLRDDSQGRTYYRGGVEDLVLGDGAIHARVDVYGYFADNGDKNLKINVVWIMDPSDPSQGIPIDVRFYSPGMDLDEDPVVPQSGVDTVLAGSQEGPVEYFNLQGVRIDRPAQGQVVIRRQGANASKVVF